MSEILDPAEWVLLDNLRCGRPMTVDLPVSLAEKALRSVLDRGFASVIDDFDEGAPARCRVTRKGQIALRLDAIRSPPSGTEKDR